jgi:hypothetical protein
MTPATAPPPPTIQNKDLAKLPDDLPRAFGTWVFRPDCPNSPRSDVT